MYKWRLYCETCELQKFVVQENDPIEPTECPTCHGINIRGIVIVDTDVVKINNLVVGADKDCGSECVGIHLGGTSPLCMKWDYETERVEFLSCDDNPVDFAAKNLSCKGDTNFGDGDDDNHSRFGSEAWIGNLLHGRKATDSYPELRWSLDSKTGKSKFISTEFTPISADDADSGSMFVDVEDDEIKFKDAAGVSRKLATGGVIMGRNKTYDDASFKTEDSPTVLDVNTDLERNGTAGFIENYGSGNIQVEISDDGDSFGEPFVIRPGKNFDLQCLNVDQVRLTWIEDTSYQVVVW